MRNAEQYAFSLVELSIVLVILGLLTGGILAGQSLIRQSEIKSLVAQKNSLATAILTFRDKYMAAPGELYNYQTIWPYLVGSYCYGPNYPAGSNRNGIIDTSFEREGAMAQLYAAGLVQNGLPQILQNGTVRSFWDCYENSMQQQAAFYSKMSGVNVMFHTALATATMTDALSIGDATHPTMTVEEAYAFDSKYDDGLPYAGRIFGFRATTFTYCNSNVYSGVVDPSVTYDLPASASKKACWSSMLLK